MPVGGWTVLAQICGAHPLALRIGLWGGLMLAGAAGSAAHCLPMCGPLVLGQVADRMARLPAARLSEACRLRQGLLVSYHLGRLVTYAALGALAAGFGAGLAALPWFAPLRTGLLLLAATLFLAHAVGRLGGAPIGGAAIGRALRRFAARLDRGTPGGTFRLGLALGLLPCGFVYAALTAAAAAPSAAQGAVAMAAFGLGTVPLLAVLGVGGARLAGARSGGWLTRAAPLLLGLNALVLALLAVATA